MDHNDPNRNEQRPGEQRILEDPFRLPRQAGHQTGPRDAAAEQRIAAALERRSAAPLMGGGDMSDFDGFDDF
jgi:hypothetical protein